MKRTYITIYLCILTTFNHGATFIFDLDGVLVHKSSIRASYQIGPSRFLGWYNPFQIKRKLFTFLNLIAPHDGSIPEICYTKKDMPLLLCQWLMGLKTTKEIRRFIKDAFQKYKTFFSNEREQKLAYAIAMCIFKPYKMSQVIVPHKKGIRLFKKIAGQTDEFGQSLHKLYILSNWDCESFQILTQHRKLQKIFTRCNGYVVSGFVQLMKPDPRIFEYTFEHHNIDPHNELIFYLDDQLQNIESAASLGKEKLVCLHCKNGKFKTAKRKLRELNII